MDKDRLVEIIRNGTYTEAQLGELGEIVHAYPWFGLPRFLRLKVYEQTGKTPDPTELERAVVFSSDRKHLYKWVTGAFDSMIGTSELGTTELEFLDSDGEEDAGEEARDEAGDAARDADPFVLLDDDASEEDETGEEEDADEKDSAGEEGGTGEEDEDDADARPIPEKDESEMEEPEMEEPESIPVMDPLDDEDYADDEEDTDQSGQGTQESPTMDDGRVPAGEAPGDKTEGSGAPGEDKSELPGTSAGEPAGNNAGMSGTATGEEIGETTKRSGPTGWAEAPAISKDQDTTAGSPGNGRQSAPNNPSTDLIERFLEMEPGVIRADQQTNLEGDVSEGSVKEDDGLITDTLAKIYVKQGLHAKAIYAYERLSLKYPEKSAYFAAQIEKIKNNANV
ncbi:MAG: hypothetical protein P1P82_04590 [Bacteroidales bacterium]|nr:hypothetical protein [Bacteroidales bacterium]MDT8432707.1 hypothetical protein [Bacteroidales bacterium]